MGAKTGITWTSHTFNIAWGCVKVSAGCSACYAETLAKRYGFDVWGPDTQRRTFGEKHWREPLRWDKWSRELGESFKLKRNATVFCSSMCDVFEDHETIDREREKLWPLIRATPNLDWQILTKRPERVARRLPPDWGTGYPNVWMGVTAEDQENANLRIPILLQIPAAIRFVSYEPALGPVDFSRWIGYHPGHEAATRRGSVQSSHARGTPDRLCGSDLARGKARMGPMEKGDCLPPVQSSSRGERHGTISDDQNDVERETIRNWGTPSGVPSLQGADPARTHCESRQREQEGQPPGESGPGNVFGAGHSCSARTSGRARGSERREKCDGETPGRSGKGDTQAQGGRGGAEIDCRSLRSDGPGGIEDRAPQTMGLDLIIVGGESGYCARPFNVWWARDTVRQCREAGVACFVKQLGSHPTEGIEEGREKDWIKAGGWPLGVGFGEGQRPRVLLKDSKGADPSEWPDDLRVQEFPVGRKSD